MVAVYEIRIGVRAEENGASIVDEVRTAYSTEDKQEAFDLVRVLEHEVSKYSQAKKDLVMEQTLVEESEV